MGNAVNSETSTRSNYGAINNNLLLASQGGGTAIITVTI